jgi:ABC-type transport system involved in multi-copper enzyme maturation permease subunit
MSATATAVDTPGERISAERRPNAVRLTAVELRKMVNTRSGFWLPITVAAITLITVIITVLLHGGHDATLVHTFRNSVMPGAFLLPVMGVLLVCGEWTQRTTLTTFTLVPSRGRIVGAKLAASVVLSLGALIVCLAFSVLFAELLGNAPGGAGSLPLAIVGQAFLYLATAMITGVAFGAAILVSAPAIVAYLLLPTIWAALAGSISALDSVARWLDQSKTLDPMTSHALSGIQWAHVVTTLAVWMALPLAIGWWRIRRRDIA